MSSALELAPESLGFILAIDNCGRGCEHCPAYGLKNKMETAPFDDLTDRLKLASLALKGTGVVERRTIHAWRIGDLADYRDDTSGGTRTVADLAEAWTTQLGQPLYTVTNGTMGVSWRQQALRDLASQPELSSQVKLTVTPYDPKFARKNYVDNMAHDVAALWPLTELTSQRPESVGQPRFRINVKTSEERRGETVNMLRSILERSGVALDIDAALAGKTDILTIKPVYDLRVEEAQPLTPGAIALSGAIETRLKREETRDRRQLGFRTNGNAFAVDMWAFSETDLYHGHAPQTFADYFSGGKES